MINIAICDDNKEDMETIQQYVIEYMSYRKLPFKIKLFMSGDALLKTKKEFEIVFLDIAMLGINGIEVGKKLKQINKDVKIIYVTSFSEHWMQAINTVHAFAYLEKPISRGEISVQIDEVLCNLDKKKEIQVVGFEVITIRNGCKAESKFMNFNMNDIYYFEYVGRKIMLKTKNGDYFFISQMKDVVQKMEQYHFACCHQIFLINLQYVQSINGYDLNLKNGDNLPISQKKSAEFRRKMNKFLQRNF